MMQIEINEQTVDRQLVDAGIGKDAEEQAVRPMFFHLFCAIRYYRDMTYAEKVKAGFLYRTKFKNVYSLTGFFKERKRNRMIPYPPSQRKKLKKATKRKGLRNASRRFGLSWSLIAATAAASTTGRWS